FNPRCPQVAPRCCHEAPPIVVLGEHRRVSCWLEADGAGVQGSGEKIKPSSTRVPIADSWDSQRQPALEADR
ncbi:MAG TPA: hypothetical protein VLT56_10255, partial [Desulfobacterales bacterium]|nr:hypothetical protein [Desulfobacterales bacterium]